MNPIEFEYYIVGYPKPSLLNRFRRHAAATRAQITRRSHAAAKALVRAIYFCLPHQAERVVFYVECDDRKVKENLQTDLVARYPLSAAC